MNVTFEKAQTKIMMKVDGKTHLLDPSANIVPLTGADEYEIRTNTGEVYRQNQKDVSVPA